VEPALLPAVVVAIVAGLPVAAGRLTSVARRVVVFGMRSRPAGAASNAAQLVMLRTAPAPATVPPPGERLILASSPAPASDTDPAAGFVRTYRVVPGDSLWAIACRQLLASEGVVPDDERINRYWRQIYAANRPVVGADPDLIFPGQRLVIPPEV
jgi:nucleoid-associated protein YgaU